MDGFKDYDINQIKEIVDDAYQSWIEIKNECDDFYKDDLDILSDFIFKLFNAYINEFPEEKEYWFEKFKDEEVIINKLKKKN